ncbi:hypothetical protein K458DRAFT_402828 [Lentithecium fluviatile CBS 122367]|uniref:Uncharacterized protein n=1 Tax=Lentithecium fluviatile CBS 122367 TaxID=1168545 RepID=A0A6G1J746_9PLEO|nr:hypothetical protein K458DRAFT_402828 [Lentithecium fluviatile CBS 122367]
MSMEIDDNNLGTSNPKTIYALTQTSIPTSNRTSPPQKPSDRFVGTYTDLNIDWQSKIMYQKYLEKGRKIEGQLQVLPPLSPPNVVASQIQDENGRSEQLHEWVHVLLVEIHKDPAKEEMPELCYFVVKVAGPPVPSEGEMQLEIAHVFRKRDA